MSGTGKYLLDNLLRDSIIEEECCNTDDSAKQGGDRSPMETVTPTPPVVSRLMEEEDFADQEEEAEEEEEANANEPTGSSTPNSSRDRARKRSSSREPPLTGLNNNNVAWTGCSSKIALSKVRPVSLSISDNSSGSKRASKTSMSQSSTTSSPETSARGHHFRSTFRNCYAVKDNDVPSYPSDEARLSAMELAMQTEQEFLDYVKTLNVSSNNNNNNIDNNNGNASSSSSPPPFQQQQQMAEGSPLRKSGFFAQSDFPKTKNSEGLSNSSSRRRRTESRSPSRNGSNSKIVGLEHLDNLCKLMEELTALRDQNSKLRKKVQHLEDEKDFQKDFSISSVTSISLQNSPEIVAKVTNTNNNSNNDGGGCCSSNGQTPKLGKKKFFQYEKKIKESNESLGNSLPTGMSPRLKKRSCGGNVPNSTLTAEYNREVRSKSFSVLENNNNNNTDIPVSISGGQSVTIADCEVASPSTKTRSLSNWTKVMVDAFKSSNKVNNSSNFSVPKCTSVAAAAAAELQTSPNNSNSMSTRYFISSSSSSSSVDFQFHLYEDDDEEDSRALNVQRSSSFTHCSKNMPSVSTSRLHGGLQRRHSLTSISEKAVNSCVKKQPSDSSGKPAKKESVSAWGKVKNMIYTRRDSLKKRSFQKSYSVDHRSSSAGFCSPEVLSSPTAAIESNNPLHFPDNMATCSTREMGAIPKVTDSPKVAKHFRKKEQLVSSSKKDSQSALAKRSKHRPQLTLTMASGEDLNLRSPTVQDASTLASPLVTWRHSGTPSNGSAADSEGRRIESQWEKVKRAFLAPPTLPSRKEDEEDIMSQSLPGSPNRSTSVFFFDDHVLLEESRLKVNSKESLSGVKISSAATDWQNVQGEIQQNYKELQRSLSQEFHRKMQLWERQRRRRDPPVSPSCPSTTLLQPQTDSSLLPADFRKKYDAWQRKRQQQQIESQPSTGSSAAAAPFHDDFVPLHQQYQQQPQSVVQPQEQHDNLPPEFRRKLEAWERMKEKGPKEECPVYKEKKIRARPLEQKQIHEEDLKPEFKLKVAEWEVRKALAGHSSKNVEEIQKMMPEDFNRKLKEWEMMKVHAKPNSPRQERKMSISSSQPKKKKSSRDHKRRNDKQQIRVELGVHQAHPQPVPQQQQQQQQQPRPKATTAGNQERDSVWLEKELNKIQREKQRLEREREKYLEREKKLERMREALEQQRRQKEITVKTAKGEEFRFGGISETFTKKLYEWEQQRGIAPELSTIALLDDSKRMQNDDDESKKTSPERVKGLTRSRSEGSLTDPNGVSAVANLTNSGGSSNKKGSGGNISQNSSQSLNDLDKIGGGGDSASGKLSFLDDAEAVPKLKSDDATPSSTSGRRQVKLSRTDSVRTHTSIKLLDENLSLIGTLKAKGDRCRQLETALEVLDDQMSDVVRSKRELSLIKREEEEESPDQTLLVHLDKKLEDLERERDELEREQICMQNSLAEEAKMHKEMTTALIDRIETFSRANPIKGVELIAPLAASEKDDVSVDIALIHRIHQLSELLADETKELEMSVRNSQRKNSSNDTRTSTSPAIPIVSVDLLNIMQELRKDMLEMLRRQGELDPPIRPLILNRAPPPPPPIITAKPFPEPTSSTTAAAITLKPVRKSPISSSAVGMMRQQQQQHCVTSLVLPLSQSESDISCGELSARYADTDEETSNSRMSSNNSMSRYGSESPLNPMLLQQQQDFQQSLKASGGGDDLMLLKAEKQLFAYRFQFLESDEDDNQHHQSHSRRISCKQRRTSSDNLSTPNSGRSRSPSIISSDFLAEEEQQSLALQEEEEEEEEEEEDTKEVSMTNIDQVCKLIHDLKEQDLRRHKKKIEEQQEKLREKSRSTHCSSDESGPSRRETGRATSDCPTALTSAAVKTPLLSSVRLIMEADEQFSSNHNRPKEEEEEEEEDTKSSNQLVHVFIPTRKTRLIPPEEIEQAAKLGLKQIKIGGNDDITEIKSDHHPVPPRRQRPEQLSLLSSHTDSSSEEKNPLLLRMKTDFLRLEAERTRCSWLRLEKSASAGWVERLPPSPPSNINCDEVVQCKMKMTSPTPSTGGSSSNNNHNNNNNDDETSIVTLDPSIEALIHEIRSRNSDSPQTPPTSVSPSFPLLMSDVVKCAQMRFMQNQKARENFLFGGGGGGTKSGEQLLQSPGDTVSKMGEFEEHKNEREEDPVAAAAATVANAVERVSRGEEAILVLEDETVEPIAAATTEAPQNIVPPPQQHHHHHHHGVFSSLFRSNHHRQQQQQQQPKQQLALPTVSAVPNRKKSPFRLSLIDEKTVEKVQQRLQEGNETVEDTMLNKKKKAEHRRISLTRQASKSCPSSPVMELRRKMSQNPANPNTGGHHSGGGSHPAGKGSSWLAKTFFKQK